MKLPAQPKIYHIVHVDRLPSIIGSGCLWCDAETLKRNLIGTPIGMSAIKQRRLYELRLASHPDLYVGDCVPFYFCPRSIMLYLIHRANNIELAYRDGQEPIIHIEADLYAAVQWAQQSDRRWAFTLSNAGARYFEDRCDLSQLNEINWDAVRANQWGGSGVSTSIKEGKQAEFLMEYNFPWHLVERIGVQSQRIYQLVVGVLPTNDHRPRVEIKPEWYY